jgi:glycosyltransferase involved in cell wall biosynthesis
MYFVQDFEPSFYAMSTDYVLAENTYRHGIYCICSGAWCSQLLRRQFGATADHFDFPLDQSIYFPRPRRKKEVNVVFFARPEMPRRCYGLGIAMLRELHRLMPEVEIIMFGANIDPGTLDFPVTVRGVLPTLNDLAQMYSDADLGIAFATTNPSLVPYEMMACGLPVVDVARPGAEVNYGNAVDVALLASPIPQEMARQVSDLLGDQAQRQARSREGRRLVSGLPTEEGAARRIEELILARVRSRGPNLAAANDQV